MSRDRGWSRHDQSQGLPMLSPSQSFRIPLARREESFSISKAPASPPPQPWAGEKLVLHKLRFHADFVAPFSPPCEGGVRGGGPGTTSHKVFPRSLPLSPFASLSRGENNRFRFPRLPHHPPCPPLRKGGKGIARWRRHSIARNKNTRLEIVPPAQSTPTFHRPTVALPPLAFAAPAMVMVYRGAVSAQ